MADYRGSFLKSVEQKLAVILDPEKLDEVSDIIAMTLADYEITDRCTDLAVHETENEKLLNTYCACLMVEGSSENTIKLYRYTMQRVSNFLRKPFAEVGTYDIRLYIATEKQRGIANTTLEYNRAVISAFFSWMIQEDLITKNPMKGIKPIKHPTKTRKPFTDVEVDAMRSACRNLKERAILEVLLSTGVRVDELSELNVSDVDFSQMSVDIRHGKGDKERKTYISQVAVKHVMKYLSDREYESVFLFTNRCKDQLHASGIHKILKGIGERAGVAHVYPHRFRITFATNLAARGMDVQEIQRLLGHSSIETTMIYVHTDDTKIKNSYLKYSA